MLQKAYTVSEEDSRDRRQGRQRKRWEDNVREWTGLEFSKSQRAVENREKWRKLVVKSSVVPQRPSQLRDWWWWWWWWLWLASQLPKSCCGWGDCDWPTAIKKMFGWPSAAASVDWTNSSRSLVLYWLEKREKLRQQRDLLQSNALSLTYTDKATSRYPDGP